MRTRAHLRRNRVEELCNGETKNFILVGHGCGKTMLAEAYTAKATDRFGKVDEGNSVMDHDPEEIKGKFQLTRRRPQNLKIISSILSIPPVFLILSAR